MSLTSKQRLQQLYGTYLKPIIQIFKSVNGCGKTTNKNQRSRLLEISSLTPILYFLLYCIAIFRFASFEPPYKHRWKHPRSSWNYGAQGRYCPKIDASMASSFFLLKHQQESDEVVLCKTDYRFWKVVSVGINTSNCRWWSNNCFAVPNQQYHEPMAIYRIIE